MTDATLFINMWNSRCGRCGKGANPNELIHDTELGYFKGPRSGCGATFVAVSSDYAGLDTVGELRPDLPFIEPFPLTRRPAA